MMVVIVLIKTLKC